MKRGRLATIATVLAVLASSGAGAARRVHGLPIPTGYRVTHRALAPGVDMFTLVRPGLRVVRVVRLKHDSKYELRAVLSNGKIFGPAPRTERTSDMCRRVRCVAAINGDFFSKKGVPSGGMVAGGEPIRSTSRQRPHFVLNKEGGLGLRHALPFSGTLTVTYKRPHPVLGDLVALEETRTLDIAGVNEPRSGSRIMAYTPRMGARTATKGNGVEMVVGLRAGKVLASTTQAAQIKGVRRGANSKIPAKSIVLSAAGEGAKALERLWAEVRSGPADLKAVLRISGPGIEAVAGKPILLRNREGVYPRGGGRQPRSIIGWTSNRDVLLVTVDGRRRGYSSGMTYGEAAGFMKAIGAVDAMNLDGGGSTTMAVRGRVVNKPSDRIVWRGGRARRSHYGSGGHVLRGAIERPVGNAIAIVRGS